MFLSSFSRRFVRAASSQSNSFRAWSVTGGGAVLASAWATSYSSAEPFDDLPEEDEPTNCSICRNFRQGPCRPYFRKYEACENDKDEQSDEEISQRCSPYVKPFGLCALKYKNLYDIRALELVMEDYIRPLLKDFDEKAKENDKKEDKKEGQEEKKDDGEKKEEVEEVKEAFTLETAILDVSGDIDEKGPPSRPFARVMWDNWDDYAEKNDWKPREGADPLSCPLPSAPEEVGLWSIQLWEKKGDRDADLDVVVVPVELPRMVFFKEEEGNDTTMQVLQTAFVTDQDGHLLGYKDVNWIKLNIEAAKRDEEEKEKEDSEGGEVDDVKSPDQLNKKKAEYKDPYKENEYVGVQLLPAASVSITVHAIYEKRSGMFNERVKVLYTSPPMPLAPK